MTEEIIIDGVNVAGCRHLKNDGIKKPICRSGGCIGVYNSCLCEDNTDCDYKQLKQAENEIEKLKGVDGNVHPDSAYYKIARLEQENKKLKYLISEEQCFEEGCNKCTKAYYTDDKYRKALEEINRVVKFAHKVEDYLLGQDYTDLVDRIEKEINEVLNNET